MDGRTVVWGPGALDAAADLIGEGFTLLTTRRALSEAPAVAARAAAVVLVPEGLVEDAAAAVRAEAGDRRLVAMGGGRVIDVAKAVASAAGGSAVLAIPTTLSGAEMTRGHRRIAGAAADAPQVRPEVVVNEPALSASAPEEALAASSANALGHALTALAADAASDEARTNAGAAVRLIAGAWAADDPDREALALGAMLAGAALDATGLGLHHAMAQTAVRTLGAGHAAANAALIATTATALSERRPALFDELRQETGVDAHVIARVLRARSRTDALAPARDDSTLLTAMVDTAAARPEIARTAPAPDRAELAALYLEAMTPTG